MGVSLEATLDAVREWRAGFPPAGQDSPEARQKTREEMEIEQNQRALAELRRMMPELGV
jgi:hypothetical protein